MISISQIFYRYFCKKSSKFQKKISEQRCMATFYCVQVPKFSHQKYFSKGTDLSKISLFMQSSLTTKFDSIFYHEVTMLWRSYW